MGSRKVVIVPSILSPSKFHAPQYKIGLNGSITPLINLFKLDSYHCKFIALMSLRKLGSRNKWKVVK